MTPVDADKLDQLLSVAKYDDSKRRYLVDGFRNGFGIGYEGEEDVQITAPNLKLTIGSETQLWNKVMKEVKLKRFAGPFKKIPFDNYIQSPIGLVPKDGGKVTRLIFHLSYPRTSKQKISVNANTPQQVCQVKYSDFNKAIQLCVKARVGCNIIKSDISSAFRNVGILKIHWKYLIMKARNPKDVWYYFVDKCLPFGAAISCAVFQAVSDAVAFLVRHQTGHPNYLDEFLFIALLKWLCDNQTKTFMQICNEIGLPVALEKTFWSTTQLVFLGLLIDTVQQIYGFHSKGETPKRTEISTTHAQ